MCMQFACSGEAKHSTENSCYGYLVSTAVCIVLSFNSFVLGFYFVGGKVILNISDSIDV